MINEYKEMLKNPEYKITMVEPDKFDAFDVEFTVKDGMYKDQTHKVRITSIGKCGTPFPIGPPGVVFLTKIWHTNINPNNGDICLDILKRNITSNNGNSWIPTMRFEGIILSIILLLENPNLDSPYNVDAARDYRDNCNKFAEIAHKFYLMHK
jgi:hypothetical protein